MLAPLGLAFALLAVVAAFSDFAQRLRVAQPGADGVYRFRLVVTEKLSMAVNKPGGNGKNVDVLDYDPDRFNPWSVRNADQTAACAVEESFEAAKHNLSSLAVLHGLHEIILAINDQMPGPEIVVPLGAEVVFEVANRMLSNSMTLHVHGIDKRGLWFTDGVAYIQQCPIAPGSDYTYRFVADTPGTHWYHGHMAMDRGQGILGAFVVHSPYERIGDEYSMILQDWPVADLTYVHKADVWGTNKWMYGFDGEARNNCFAGTKTYDGSNVGGVVATRAVAVNGKGWHNQTDVVHRPEKLPIESFSINPGKPVKLRITNAGISHTLMVTVDGHELIIIGADGAPVHPVVADMVILMPGERYDVHIHGLKKPDRAAYPIVIETLEHYSKTNDVVRPLFGVARLVYDKHRGLKAALTPDWFHGRRCGKHRCLAVNCPFSHFPHGIPIACHGHDELRAVVPSNDAGLLSNSGFGHLDTFVEEFVNIHYDNHMNGWIYTPPRSMPYFDGDNAVTRCDRTTCSSELDGRYDESCSCFFHFEFPLGAVVQLTLYNMGYGGGFSTGSAHPFHMHGTHFHVVQMGFGDYDEATYEIRPNADIDCGATEHCNERGWRNVSWHGGRLPDMNSVDPPLRDTVTVPVGGYVVIRFRASNPGWWYAHCHLINHHMAGMAFAYRVGDHDEHPVPPPGFPHTCGRYEPPPLGDELFTAFPHAAVKRRRGTGKGT